MYRGRVLLTQGCQVCMPVVNLHLIVVTRKILIYMKHQIRTQHDASYTTEEGVEARDKALIES